MQSELPELARARHHWIVLLRWPGKFAALGMIALFVLAIVKPVPFVLLFILVLVAAAALRWQTWKAELIILTTKRIVRVRGVPETTTSEASLRIDRVSGARLIQTVPGKLLDYGTIELEAPGDHPDVRHLVRIAKPKAFYDRLRRVVFGEELRADPDFGTTDRYEPIPPPEDPEQNFVTDQLPRFFRNDDQ
jgi:hypothetical protein